MLCLMNIQTTSGMTIGAAAKTVGINIDTIRYYEREGVLPRPVRRASGYRQYDAAALANLRFIRRAKALGFSLGDIRELLALSADREHGVAGVKAQAEARLADVEHRIRELRRVQRGLKTLIEVCPGHGTLAGCPILKALGDEERK